MIGGVSCSGGLGSSCGDSSISEVKLAPAVGLGRCETELCCGDGERCEDRLSCEARLCLTMKWRRGAKAGWAVKLG